MSKLLNGIINEQGFIIPLSDRDNIVRHEAEDSLLYCQFKSGSVTAKIYLAEFDDGGVVCCSKVFRNYSHTSHDASMRPGNQKDRDAAIRIEKKHIIDLLKEILSNVSPYTPESTIADCKNVMLMVYHNNTTALSDSDNRRNDEEPLTLPLVF